MTRQQKQEMQSNVLHAAMSVMYREDLNDEELAECRKQIARIEKLFGYQPFSFAA